MGIFLRHIGAIAVVSLAFASRVHGESAKTAISRASKMGAAALLAPKSKITQPRVPLAGSLLKYLNAVVGTNGVGKVTSITLKKCYNDKSHSCVQFIAKACPPGVVGDCEGLDLTLFVDVTVKPPRLDFGFASMPEDVVHDQSDIEKYLSEAP